MDRRERNSDATEALLSAFQGLKAEIWNALPGIIESFNAAEQTVTVQPAIKAQWRDPLGAETWVSLPLLLDCPVVFPSGGGATLTFPIKKGDECLVVFASRCIDAWWDQGTEGVQAEMRMHDLSDGFCIPGPRSRPRALPSISTTTVQLRSDDGEAFVELNPISHNINLQTVGNINAHADGNANVDAGGEVHLSAPIVRITGTLVVEGPISQSGGDTQLVGPLVVTGEITGNGIELSNHAHLGVRDGPNTSLGPINLP